MSVDIALAAKRLLSRLEAAKYLNVSKQTLAHWAATRRVELPYVKIGRLAKYRLEDLDKFIAERTQGHAAGQ